MLNKVVVSYSYKSILCEDISLIGVQKVPLLTVQSDGLTFQKVPGRGCSILFYFIIIIFKIYLFLAALALLCCARAFSLVAASRGYSLLRCTGFSLRWLLLLRSTGSRHAG